MVGRGPLCFRRCLRRCPHAAIGTSGRRTECPRWPVMAGCRPTLAAGRSFSSYVVSTLSGAFEAQAESRPHRCPGSRNRWVIRCLPLGETGAPGICIRGVRARVHFRTRRVPPAAGGVGAAMRGMEPMASRRTFRRCGGRNRRLSRLAGWCGAGRPLGVPHPPGGRSCGSPETTTRARRASAVRD